MTTGRPAVRSATRSRRQVILAAEMLTAAVGVMLAAGPAASEPPPFRPETRIRLEMPVGAVTPDFTNPNRCAFIAHDLAVVLDTTDAHLRGEDRILLLHPADASTDLTASFLLNRSLRVEEIETVPWKPIQWEERERWEPLDFWPRPEYGELEGMEHVRQIDLRLDPEYPYRVWPESLLVRITYEGTVYDSLKPPKAAYQRGFETTRGLIDPRGVFLSGATAWYPLRPGEMFTFRLRARGPEDWEIISQGALDEDGHLPVELSSPATRRVMGWSCPHPMEEIYLVAGPYVFREEDHRGIKVQTFTYGNGDEELCWRYMDATKDYLDLYGDLIGPYPFAKFALIENFWQTGYGMPSFTLLGNRVIRLPFIVSTSYGHEILHNWWGNGVFVDWEQGNWCEGLTVYGADYLYKEQESAEAARDYRRTTLQGYRDYVRHGRDMPLTAFRARHDASSQAIGYGKSMMVFHMLRWRVGDRAFWESLSEFYNRYRFREASWQDLLGVFRDVTGFRLDRFHEQWIARAGAPLLTLGAVQTEARPGEGFDVQIVIEQEEPAYELPVPVRLTMADGSTRETLILLSGQQGEVREFLPSAPRLVAVDPDFDIFRRLHRAEVPAALSQVMGADSVVAVIAAGESDSMRAAYREVLQSWRSGDRTATLPDDRASFHRLSGCGVWLFGQPFWLGRIPGLPPELHIGSDYFEIDGERFDRELHTLVAALPHPTDQEEASGLVLAPEAELMRTIGRKLPHYGKYSYLVFAEDVNVAKGSWRVGQSPLLRVLE